MRGDRRRPFLFGHHLLTIDAAVVVEIEPQHQPRVIAHESDQVELQTARG